MQENGLRTRRHPHGHLHTPMKNPRGVLDHDAGWRGYVWKGLQGPKQLNACNCGVEEVRMEAERDGFPVTAMREIKLLQSLRHDNVVRLHEMMVSNVRSHISSFSLDG